MLRELRIYWFTEQLIVLLVQQIDDETVKRNDAAADISGPDIVRVKRVNRLQVSYLLADTVSGATSRLAVHSLTSILMRCNV